MIAGKRKLLSLRGFQGLLTSSGVISLVSLDEDVIRWSGIANGVIEGWRDLTSPLLLALSAVFGFQFPGYVRDILLLTLAAFAAANVYSIQKYGRVAVVEAARMFWFEQVTNQGYRIPSMDFIKAAAQTAVALAWVVAAILAASPRSFGISVGWLGHAALAVLTAYVMAGFVYLSRLQEKGPPIGQVDRDFSRRFLRASLLFLPGAIYRYLTFFLFCIFVIFFQAWRFYLYVIAGFLALLLLNEIYLRAAKEWDVRPSCVLYSIEETCSAPGREVPPPPKTQAAARQLPLAAPEPI